jgi:hypothetical protein
VSGVTTMATTVRISVLSVALVVGTFATAQPLTLPAQRVETGKPKAAKPSAPKPREPTACELAARNGPIKTVDMRKVADILAHAAFAKKEFETTPEYQRRIAELPELKQVRELTSETGNEHLVFTEPISNHDMRYDADQEKLVIGTGSGVLGMQKQLIDYVGRSRNRIVLSYSYSVTFAGLAQSGPPLVMILAPAVAKRIKPQLAVLIVADLKPPYVEEIPLEVGRYGTFINETVIQTSLHCAALYDLSEGKIIAPLTAGQL